MEGLTGISAREAAERLGIDRESARRALAAGLAGPGVPTRSAVLYDAERIEQLAARAPLDRRDVSALPEACRTGMMLVRLGRDADLTAPRPEQLDAARRWFRMSPWTRVLIRHRARTRGSVPFVATLAGFVVLGADIIDVEVDDRLGASVRLTDPGNWFEDWRGGRFDRGRGSRWQWWDATEESGWSRPRL